MRYRSRAWPVPRFVAAARATLAVVKNSLFGRYQAIFAALRTARDERLTCCHWASARSDWRRAVCQLANALARCVGRRILTWLKDVAEVFELQIDNQSFEQGKPIGLGLNIEVTARLLNRPGFFEQKCSG